MNKYYTLILVSLFFSCQHIENDMTGSTTADEEVKATLVEMWDAIENGDVDRYANFIHPDFTQFGETDSILNVGKSVEVDAMRSYMLVARDVHTEMVNPIVTVNGDVAWITYYWKDRGFNNTKPFASHGKSTRIFVRENSRWLCIHGHYTLL